MIQNFGPRRTLWVICCLTVPGHKEAVVHRRSARGAHGSWQAVGAWRAREPSWTRGAVGSRLSFLARGAVKTRNTRRSG